MTKVRITKDNRRFLDNPDTSLGGYLLYGDDLTSVEYGRVKILNALRNAGDRTTIRRLTTQPTGKRQGELVNGIKSSSLFTGVTVVWLDGVSDASFEAAKLALENWNHGDGCMLLTVGRVRNPPKLRKLFENSKRAAAIEVKEVRFNTAYVINSLKGINFARNEPTKDAAFLLLMAVQERLAPLVFEDVIEKIKLLKSNDDSQLKLCEAFACVPPEEDATMDHVLSLLLDNREDRLGPALRQVYRQGQNPVSVLISAQRRFQAIYNGRRTPFSYSLRWDISKIEDALVDLLDADRKLRSPGKVPEHAIVERVLTRISMMGKTDKC